MNTGNAASQRHQHAQQARQQLAQHQLGVGKVRQQQQDQGVPVLFVGDFAGRQEGGEESGQRQLQGRQDLKHCGTEPRQVAHVTHQLRTGQHQPRRAHQHQQRQPVRRPGDVELGSSRGNRHLASEHRANQQDMTPDAREPDDVSGRLCFSITTRRTTVMSCLRITYSLTHHTRFRRRAGAFRGPRPVLWGRASASTDLNRQVSQSMGQALLPALLANVSRADRNVCPTVVRTALTFPRRRPAAYSWPE